MAEIDTKLAAALKQANSSPMCFAFVAKGADGRLLVRKTKVPANEAAAAKSALGGGAIWRGRCFAEDGVMVFEVPKEPPPVLAKQVKSIIQRDAGLNMKVDVRFAKDLGETDGDAAEVTGDTSPATSAQATAPPNRGAEFGARLKRLAPNYLKAVQRGGETVADLNALFSQAKALYERKDFDRANEALDKLEPLVALALAVRQEAAVPPPADGSATFKTRLKALLPEIKKSQGAAAPVVAQIMKAVSEANGFAQKNDWGNANTALDRVERLLANARQIPVPPPPTPEADPAAHWQRRISALEPKVLEASKTRPNEAKWMTLFMSAQDFSEAQNFAKALAVLDKLEGLLSAAPAPPARTDDAAVSNVVYTQSRLAWDRARKNALAELQGIEQKLLAHCRSANDDAASDVMYDLTDSAARIKSLYTILGTLDERLMDKLDEALNAADPQQRKARQQEAKNIINGYQGFVESNPLLAAMADSEVAPSQLKQTLLGVLADLASKT